MWVRYPEEILTPQDMVYLCCWSGTDVCCCPFLFVDFKELVGVIMVDVLGNSRVFVP